jgi:RNA polymerase sigma-70 factor (ECF subfamily)
MSATALVEAAPPPARLGLLDERLGRPSHANGRAVWARPLDAESRAWWLRLHGMEPVRNRAIAELQELLRREAGFHLRLRTRGMSEFPRSDLDDLAVQAANDALLAVLRKLDDYRGESQFWTWARRFVQLEAPVSIRRRLGRDLLASDPDCVSLCPDPGCSPE